MNDQGGQGAEAEARAEFALGGVDEGYPAVVKVSTSRAEMGAYLPLLRPRRNKSVAYSTFPLVTYWMPPSMMTCIKSIISSAVPAADLSFDDFEDELDELDSLDESKSRLSRLKEGDTASRGTALAQRGVMSESA